MSELSTQIPSDVNPAQWGAICHEDGHLLITAGPGTGKTHTLTRRIARCAGFLRGNERILAVTFTNKAALEMKERLTRLGIFDGRRIFVGTFHAFCLDFLRAQAKEAGLPPDFKVISPEEAAQLAREFWPELKSAERKARLEEIAREKMNGAAGGELVEQCIRKPAGGPVEQWLENLRTRGLLDFDDLLTETVKLLSANETFRREIQEAAAFIFVDEYQDINPLQRQLLKLLTGERTKVTAIGDPNQAIYGFRGSDVAFFETFSEDFPGALTLSLEDNYRSAQNLLTASGQVIAKGRRLALPNLTARLYDEGRLVIHQAPTDKAEAEYVVHTIEQLVGGTSMFSQDSGRVNAGTGGERSFGDIAVLYRLKNQHYALKTALERSGIPYEVAGIKDAQDDLLPGDDAYEARSERVKLMTLHAAKGLEFSVVFIVGCEEGILPLNLESFTGDEEEERRLFYVGMTRAKTQLYLTHADRRPLFGKFHAGPPSRFLTDIEEELRERDEVLHKRKKKRDAQLDLFGKF